MNGAFILIIVLGGYSSQSGFASVVAQFGSLAACEAARKHIVESISRKVSGDPYAQLRSHGCYGKDRPL